MCLLHIVKPSGQVTICSLLHKRSGDLVGPNCNPYLGIELADSVTVDIRSQGEVLVEISEERLNSLELRRREPSWQLG